MAVSHLLNLNYALRLDFSRLSFAVFYFRTKIFSQPTNHCFHIQRPSCQPVSCFITTVLQDYILHAYIHKHVFTCLKRAQARSQNVVNNLQRTCLSLISKSEANFFYYPAACKKKKKPNKNETKNKNEKFQCQS